MLSEISLNIQNNSFSYHTAGMRRIKGGTGFVILVGQKATGYNNVEGDNNARIFLELLSFTLILSV
jgi:hypothetical protein